MDAALLIISPDIILARRLFFLKEMNFAMQQPAGQPRLLPVFDPKNIFNPEPISNANDGAQISGVADTIKCET